MITDEITLRLTQCFGHTPTDEQSSAIRLFAHFLVNRNPHSLMLMRGSAGTGKSSLAGAFVQALGLLGQKTVLMAPTGRAAKVFSLNSGGHAAFTIHRKIYRLRAFAGVGGEYNLNDNLHADTLFMVDEASMVANGGGAEAVFGSGRLLDDLVRYVYAGRNCRLVLIGDQAQLPPVG
ncbi:MAG: AAA family ATPase, partial [Prevotella conceptionensis]